jgi:hypothetical protein
LVVTGKGEGLKGIEAPFHGFLNGDRPPATPLIIKDLGRSAGKMDEPKAVVDARALRYQRDGVGRADRPGTRPACASAHAEMVNRVVDDLGAEQLDQLGAHQHLAKLVEHWSRPSHPFRHLFFTLGGVSGSVTGGIKGSVSGHVPGS